MRDPSPEQKREILIFVHQSQRDESLEHRKSIHTAFSLTMAGLAAILAGVISAGQIGSYQKVGVGIAIMSLCFITLLFMRQQRQEARAAMDILIPIEEELELYEKDIYLKDKSVLPDEFRKPKPTTIGLTRGDRLQAICIFILSFIILGVLVLL
jgi:hypothetical protein